MTNLILAARVDPTLRRWAQEVDAELGRLQHANESQLAVLRAIVDGDDPCRYDHNGYCQEHYASADGCAVAQAVALLLEADEHERRTEGEL